MARVACAGGLARAAAGLEGFWGGPGGGGLCLAWVWCGMAWAWCGAGTGWRGLAVGLAWAWCGAGTGWCGAGTGWCGAGVSLARAGVGLVWGWCGHAVGRLPQLYCQTPFPVPIPVPMPGWDWGAPLQPRRDRGWGPALPGVPILPPLSPGPPAGEAQGRDPGCVGVPSSPLQGGTQPSRQHWCCLQGKRGSWGGGVPGEAVNGLPPSSSAPPRTYPAPAAPMGPAAH